MSDYEPSLGKVTEQAAIVIEQSTAAFWNTHAARKYSEIPEQWKPKYRVAIANALVAAGLIEHCHNCGALKITQPKLTAWVGKRCVECGFDHAA